MLEDSKCVNIVHDLLPTHLEMTNVFLHNMSSLVKFPLEGSDICSFCYSTHEVKVASKMSTLINWTPPPKKKQKKNKG